MIYPWKLEQSQLFTGSCGKVIMLTILIKNIKEIDDMIQSY